MPDPKPQQESPDDVPENARTGGEPAPSGRGKHDPDPAGGRRSSEPGSSKPRGNDRPSRRAASIHGPISPSIEDFFYWCAPCSGFSTTLVTSFCRSLKIL
jgi:hypothetical protein